MFISIHQISYIGSAVYRTQLLQYSTTTTTVQHHNYYSTGHNYYSTAPQPKDRNTVQWQCTDTCTVTSKWLKGILSLKIKLILNENLGENIKIVDKKTYTETGAFLVACHLLLMKVIFHHFEVIL